MYLDCFKYFKKCDDETTLIETFLKDHRFLLTSANAYNALGVGTTQLYNETVVYNHKRHGKFILGGRLFSFQVKHVFPKKLSKEFLLVDLVNNLEQLAEDHENLLKSIKKKVFTFDKDKLVKAVRNYGNVRTKKFFAETLEDERIQYVAYKWLYPKIKSKSLKLKNAISSRMLKPLE